MHRNSNSRDVGSLVLEGGGRAGRFGRLLGSYFRADRAGIVAFGVILLLCASLAHAQTGIRWDLGAPGSAGAVAAAASGGLPTLLAQPGVTLAWCNHPANAVPCTNYATTYTSLLLSTPCATNAQIVLQGSTTCQAQSDFMGDLGVYTATNTVCTVTCYDYTLTVNGVSYGPFVWTMGGSASGGSSLPVATAAGQYPNSTGAGTTYVAQSKSVVDVRDLGVDCTGATDASTILNAFSLTQKELDFPYNCQVRLDHAWLIFGATGFLIRGMGDRPEAGGFGGPSLYGCNGSAGALIYINRSGFGRIEGLGIYPKGPVGICASSSFTMSVQIDNTGGGGVTTHDITLDHLGLSSNAQGAAISGYIGVQLTSPGANNVEMVIFRNSLIHCQQSANSIGFDNEAAASDKDSVEYNAINSCFIGVKQNAGNTTVQHNLFGSVGAFSIFGANGGAVWIGACASGAINVLFNEHDSGGPFINSNNDATGGCGLVNLIGNDLGVSDISNTAYPINVGTANGIYYLAGNTINLTQAINQYLMGSSSQSGVSHGPLGTLYDLGTNLQGSTLSNSLGLSNQAIPFQQGEYHLPTATGTNTVLGPNATLTASDSLNHTFFAALRTIGFAGQSPFLALRATTGAAFDDWTWQSIANSVNSSLLFSHTKGAATNLWFNWDGSVSGLNLAQLTAPNAPGNINVIGAAGGTTYTYAVVAFGQTGNTAGSGTISTAVGNATLNSTNFNQIQWTIPTVTAAGYGANKYCIWRTVGGATQGKIGCVSAVGLTSNSADGNVYYFNDTGLAGDTTALPATNTTGGASLAPITVSNLPTAASSPGMMFRVSDSTVVAAEGQACVGGSTHNALAFSDGTAWKCF